MFRTKLKFTTVIASMAILSATFFGCSTNQTQGAAKDVSQMLNMNAISGDSSGAEEVYKVADVTMGDISEIAAARGYVSLPVQYEIAHEQEIGTVVFNNWAIATRGASFVEEGEIVASLKMYADPLAAEDAKLKYEKAVYNYENALDKKNEELADLLEDIANETNVYQKQILELDYEVTLTEYNKYVEEQTSYISELEAALNIYTQESGEIYLTAPISGIFEIDYDGILGNGISIPAGEKLAKISSFEEVFIEVITRNASQFKYGQTVEIKFTSAVPALTLTGRVISAPNILYNSNSNRITIEITSAFPEITTMSNSVRNNASVLATNNYVQNGIIIPSSALSNTKGNIGVVNVLENGTIVKKHVKYGYKGADYAWILEGLEVGQQVTTK